MSMTAKVGRAGADEQGRDYRVRPDSAGAGSYPRSAAPDRTALQQSASRYGCKLDLQAIKS